mgnify:CR=1 FL=1
MKNNQKLNLFPKFFSLTYITVYEILFILGLIIVRLILNSTINYQKYFTYEAPFYDTGTLMSLLICLEHLFVSYYLIIIIIMVYWCLYIFIVDFLFWTPTNYNYTIKYYFTNILNIFIKNIMNIYIYFYLLILKFLRLFKEKEYLLFLNLSHINFGRDSSIPKKFIGLFPFHFKKKYLNRINIINILGNKLKQFDILGRSLITLNLGIYKFNIIVTLIKESIYLIKRYYNYSTYIISKKMSFYLFYSKPKSFFFAIENLIIYKKNNNKNILSYNYNLANIRSSYKDIFSLNQFKHSGVFEAIWAAFPTIIIISILIPSLILLYSFEDILNPKLSVKVIGNQWYWSYEFNNWINFKIKNDDEILNKNIYMSYAFNSVIIDTDNLELGFKRLLEVDNRLVLPTNMTTRFLVSSSDVLHSFAMPELGFKVDANPGRLNQILVYISRPGVYYGQCSELCGTSHAFMPIVIQAVTPDNFINYIEKIKNNF